MVSINWPQTLASRMRQQQLEPVGDELVEDVVGRLGAVHAQFDSAAERAIGGGVSVPRRARSPAPWRMA